MSALGKKRIVHFDHCAINNTFFLTQSVGEWPKAEGVYKLVSAAFAFGTRCNTPSPFGYSPKAAP